MSLVFWSECCRFSLVFLHLRFLFRRCVLHFQATVTMRSKSDFCVDEEFLSSLDETRVVFSTTFSVCDSWAPSARDFVPDSLCSGVREEVKAMRRDGEPLN